MSGTPAQQAPAPEAVQYPGFPQYQYVAPQYYYPQVPEGVQRTEGTPVTYPFQYSYGYPYGAPVEVPVATKAATTKKFCGCS